eukprot:1964685-Pyramimonas_sp.AAC.1
MRVTSSEVAWCRGDSSWPWRIVHRRGYNFKSRALRLLRFPSGVALCADASLRWFRATCGCKVVACPSRIHTEFPRSLNPTQTVRPGLRS